MKVKVLKGEGSLITVRGKRKIGYEMDIEITFNFIQSEDEQSSSVSSEVQCIVKMIEISEDEEDCVEYVIIKAGGN